MNLIRILLQRLGIYYFIVDRYFKWFVIPTYQKKELQNKQRFLDQKVDNVLDVSLCNSLKNINPNSGGFPVEVEKLELDKLKTEIINNDSRKSNNSNFEGLALNDAVATESWKHFSFYDLALNVIEIARSLTGKTQLSILEMGCGAGSMFDFYKSMGTKVYIGLDGNPLAFEHSKIIKNNPACFRLVNLQEEINFNYGFDLVYTSEVLEHISVDKTSVFIKTIANHMKQDSVFIGTIATTVMDVHINIHPRKWWLEKFAEHNLYPIIEESDIAKKIGNAHPYNWNPNTSHIFILKLIK